MLISICGWLFPYVLVSFGDWIVYKTCSNLVDDDAKIQRNQLNQYFLAKPATQKLGSISAAFSSPVSEPPREERLDAWATDRICDVTEFKI